MMTVDDRRNQLAQLKRKYGPSLDTVLETLDSLKQQVARTDKIQQDIVDIEQRIKDRQAELETNARELSFARKTAASDLADLAMAELYELEMDKARFEVGFEALAATGKDDVLTRGGEKIGPQGFEKVQFLLSPNPGEPVKPLVKIASGGELSRIVLALKAVLSKIQSLETLIFDEVDAGIGGATSQKVGLKLSQLARTSQVICITHLAQIAKFAQHHYQIKKQVTDGRTATTILPLSDESGRIDEIARMIGGSDISKATRAHAKELLDNALS